MKTIKSFLLVSFLLVGNILFAQHSGNGPGDRPSLPPPIPSQKQIDKMVDKMAGEVGLDAIQKEQVLKLYTAHFIMVRKKFSENNPPRREEIEALDLKLEKQVKELLTQEQSKKYEGWLKKQRRQHQRR